MLDIHSSNIRSSWNRNYCAHYCRQHHPKNVSPRERDGKIFFMSLESSSSLTLWWKNWTAFVRWRHRSATAYIEIVSPYMQCGKQTFEGEFCAILCVVFCFKSRLCCARLFKCESAQLKELFLLVLVARMGRLETIWWSTINCTALCNAAFSFSLCFAF